MEILMLGNSGSGKTSYMISTYGIMQNPIQGFTLKAKKSDHHRKFISLYDSLRRYNKYPAPTDKYDEYKFDLCFAGDSVLSFSWKDYRGGLIDTPNGNDPELKKLQKAISNSDAVILFFEADALMNNDEERTRVDQLLYLLFHNASARDKKLQIVTLITKFDMLSDELGQEDIDQMLSPISNLGQMVECSENVNLVSLPVACTRDYIMHVDLVFLWLMREGIEIDYIDEASNIREEYSEAVRLWNEGGFWDELKWMFDDRKLSKRSEARDVLSNAEQRKNGLEQMENAYNKINDFIKNYELFTYNLSESGDIFNF